MKIFENLTQLIGHTPLVELSRLAEKEGVKARILAKIEAFNPGGSSKDRVALHMIEKAEKEGLLKEGSTIIEPTSGNTGVGLAWIGSSKGYKVLIVMPDSMSKERQSLLKASGAELILTPGAQGMKGAIEEAERLHSQIDGSVVMGQFTNPCNPEAHELTTGEEIWEDTEGEVDIFVAGVGTGGTITGTARALKKHNPKVRIVGVEPAGSAVLSGGQPGKHDLQGIGAGFVPQVYDASVVDEIVPVSDEDAYRVGRQLVRLEGVLAGITSGAALWAALQLGKRPENEGKCIVALLPDTGERYLSTKLFAE